MTANSTGQAPAAGPASTPTAVSDDSIGEAPKRNPNRPIHPSEPTLWQRRTYRFGRYAVLAIPVFALIAGLLPRSSAAFSTDPAVYAHYLATGQWRPREVLATYGLAVTGVLSIVGLASLLFRGRARGFALAGLVAGLAGSAGMLASIGSTVIREDRLPHAVVSGHRQLAFNAHTVGAGSAFLVIGGALLLTLGWILLGIAVIRTSGMNRADGPLLMISTPLIFLGGMVVHVLPTMGSFLLLAAGLGILAMAGRISIIGEDTWRQRRRRPAVALTTSVAAPTSAAISDPDAGIPLDRAPGLAGALGLARPQLFPDSRIASAAIYHAPVASAAEASEPAIAPGADSSESTVAPVASGPAASNGDAPAGAVPSSAAPSDNGASANGEGPSDPLVSSNGTAAVNATAASNGAGAPNGPAAPNGTASNGTASNGTGLNGTASNGSAEATDTAPARADNGSAGDGKPAGNDRPPAVKSLRDLLRGARGAAAAWPVYRARSGGPNAGTAARDNGGQPGNRSGGNRNAAADRTGTTGGSDTAGRAATNGRTGTNSRAGGRPDARGGRRTNSSSAAGRSAKGRTPQPPPPPPPPSTDKPDPPHESPPARE